MGVYLNFGLLTHKFTYTVIEGISIYVVFYFYFVSTSLPYITIHKNKNKKTCLR